MAFRQPAARLIGYKRLVRFPDATISRLRIRFTQFRVRPTLASMGLYFAPPILSAPKITRDAAGMVTIKPPAGTFARYTLDGSEPTEASQRYIDPIPMPKGGVVTAQTFPLISDSRSDPEPREHGCADGVRPGEGKVEGR